MRNYDTYGEDEAYRDGRNGYGSSGYYTDEEQQSYRHGRMDRQNALERRWQEEEEERLYYERLQHEREHQYPEQEEPQPDQPGQDDLPF